MIGNDGKCKVRSKAAQYISFKTPQNILRVTRRGLKKRRKLFSSPIFVVNYRISKTFLTFPKRAGQGLFICKFYSHDYAP